MNALDHSTPNSSQDADTMTHEATTNTTTRKLDAATMAMLRKFIGPMQMTAIQIGMQGEERAYFIDKLIELGERIAAMPKTYETDGQGLSAIVHLHYFRGIADWYIVEKDAGDANDDEPGTQHQAFGLACIEESELGYISIVELLRNRVELDMHFTPTTLGAIREKRA